MAVFCLYSGMDTPILTAVKKDLDNAIAAHEKGFCVLSIYWATKHRAAIKRYLKRRGYTDYDTGMALIGYPYAYYYLTPRPWYKQFVSILLRPFNVF